MNALTVEGLCKTYRLGGRDVPVLRELTLTLPAGGITVILGKSGCGKTTLLRLLAGLEEPDGGAISLGGQAVGMVFQEPRLMPWLKLRENILFGLDKKARAAYPIDALLALVGLEGFGDAYPRQLSGGMQSRAAIARVIASDPAIILMDEPFAALDNFNREAMQRELIRIQQESRKSVLFVTHNIDEALTLGTGIVLMSDGVIQRQLDLSQWAYPRDLLAPDIIRCKQEITAFFNAGEIIHQKERDNVYHTQ